MNLLFWNINKKDVRDSLCSIVKEHDIDIIILAEQALSSVEIVQELNKEQVDFFPQHPLSQCTKVQIYTKFHYNFIDPIFETNRYTIRKMSLPGKKETLITAIHLVDKSNHSNESQSEQSSIIIQEIEKTEDEYGIHSNIIVGDFNMNPFEQGLIKANGFHATMSKKIASERTRVVQEKTYKYLYNPMWSLYGDLFNEPIGTYHYRNAELVNYGWNIFDQVLLRPEIMDRFESNSLDILTNDGAKELVKENGTPLGGKYNSDHLPIKFTIDLNL